MNRLHNLELLTRSLAELEEVLAGGEQAFVAESMRHHAAEQLLELLVESAAQINRELSHNQSDYYSSFFTVGLEVATARTLADLAGMRNKIEHHYTSVKLDKLFRTLQASLPHWQRYATHVSTQP